MIEFNKIEEVDNFVAENQLAFLYVSSPDCNVCKALLPKIKEMLVKYPEIATGYVDIKKISEAAGKYSVFSIPAMIFYIDGKETIRKARYVSVAELEGEISRYYSLLVD